MERAPPARPHQSRPSYLGAIPPEIILLVRDQLPQVSGIALALACKSFLRLLYPALGLPVLGKRDLVDLLLLLEKDNPNCFLCFGCTRLRLFNPRRKLGWRDQGHRACGDETEDDVCSAAPLAFNCARCCHSTRACHAERHGLSWRPRDNGPEVTFSEAHLVMNRHRYGEGYGISCKALESDFDFERYVDLDAGTVAGHFPLEQHPPGRRHLTRARRETILGDRAKADGQVKVRAVMRSMDRAGYRPDTVLARKKQEMVRLPLNSTPIRHWRFRHSYKARVVDGELYLASFHHITGPGVSVGRFTRLLSCVGLPVCRHLHVSASLPYSDPGRRRRCCRTVPQFRALLDSVDGVRQCPADCSGGRQGVGSCVYCYTDYEISIRGGRGQADWDFRLSTYHRLGGCRSPEDPVWRRLTDFPRMEIRNLDGEFGPGEVGRRWQKREDGGGVA